MEAQAKRRYAGSSPRKMRLVVDLIRNRKVSEAVSILDFTNKQAATVVKKTLISAYNNLINKLEGGKITQNDVIIKKAYVDEGPTLKRIRPAPQGRAYRVRKRSAHLTLVVEKLEIKQI